MSVLQRPTIDWLGCATFRLRIDRLTLLLDAYIDRVPSAPATGVRTSDIDECDWILIGHSHFDHLWGAEKIMARTDARALGSYETARVLRSLGVPGDRIVPVAGGERLRLSSDVTVRVLPSLHSCVWTHTAAPPVDQVCLGDIGVDLFEQLERSAEFVDFVKTLGPEVLGHLGESDQGAHGDGGTLAYIIESTAGTVLFQDTAGCWTGLFRDIPHPDVAILAAGSRGNLDGDPVQGSLVDFLMREVEILRPGSIILCHHDDWLPGLTSPFDEELVRKALANGEFSTTLVSLDYASSYPLLG